MEPAIDDGGPASPFDEKNDDGTHYHGNPGMSLRQHYAGLFMKAELMMCSVPGAPAEALGRYVSQTGESRLDAMAGNAMLSADALIRASHTPPQKVEQPFDVAMLTRQERGALVNLRSHWNFHSLPADIKAKSEAAAEFVEPSEDDGIPF